jgi:hypothetical protein
MRLFANRPITPFSRAVFDVHQGWCGPCSVMEPVMRKVKLDNEKLQVKFFTVRCGCRRRGVDRGPCLASWTHGTPLTPPKRHPLPRLRRSTSRCLHPHRKPRCHTRAAASPCSSSTRCDDDGSGKGARESFGHCVLQLLTPSPRPPHPHSPPRPQNKVIVSKVQGVNAPELETQVVDNAPESNEEE